MSAAAYRGDSWRRLPWLLPSALLLSLLSLTGFIALLTGPRYRPAPQAPVEVQLVELPPTPATPAAAPSPPPPIAEPEPLPLPEPEAKPLPEPPPPPPPPRRPPRIVRPEKPAPAVPPPPAAAPAAPAPTAPLRDAAPPAGAVMGARAIYKPLPEIPEELRRRTTLALVAVARFHVAADGSAQVELIEPTPDPSLNQALMATLRKWRFFPAMEAGRPVASDLDIRIPVSVK
jgi:protein TonB